MKQKFILFALILTIGALVFAGSEGEMEKDEGKEKVVLDFAPMYGAKLNEDLYATFVERFEDANPDIEINLILQPSSGTMHRDFLKTLQATDQFPDVMTMASPSDFVNSGLLMSLPITEMDYLKIRDTQIFDGENYVAVYKKMVGGFWFNKDMFADLGLDAPSTYADLIEVCKAIKSAGITPISMGVKDGWPQLVLASMILSEDILSDNANWGFQRNAGNKTFTDPDFVRAIEKYMELVRNYATDAPESVTYEQMKQAYFNGQAAMIPMGSWIIGEIESANIDFTPGFFPVPGDNDAKNVSVWQNEGLSISAATEYPEEALRLIEFYMTDPVWYSSFLSTEALFSTSKSDISFEKSDFRKEVGAQVENLNGVEHWYDMTGDNAPLPGLQAFFNNFTALLATESDPMTQLKRFDEEWELANSNLQ